MPINHEKCIRYKDTWAAPGSALHAALTEGDEKKAKAIYEECERVFQGHNKNSEPKGKVNGRS